MTVNLQSVEDDSYLSDVFLNILNILNEEATTVDSSCGQVELTKHANCKHWVSSYPDEYITGSDDFPLAVLHSPLSSDVRRGWDFSEEYYTFRIEVFSNRAEFCALFISKAWDALKRYDEQLMDQGLYHISHEQIQKGMTMRGEMKIHDMSMPITVRRIRE